MTDNYNREILIENREDADVYTVISDSGNFSIEFPSGTSMEQVLSTINAMAPG